MRHIGGKLMAAVILLTSWTSCINEDLSDCGKDYSIRYDVKLKTNLQTELDTELETIEEKELGRRLKEALKNVFSDQARDLDLTFYGADSTLNYEETHVINSNKASYTIYLPVRDYQHLALANDDQEKNIVLKGREYAPDMVWEQIQGDTLESYENGLFSGRMKMEVKDQDQVFEVQMYMQISAAALVVNPNGVAYRSMRGVLTHLADGFTVRDSIYHHHDRSVIRVKNLGDTGSALRCLYGVGFPSRDLPYVSRAASDAEKGACWEFRAYVTMPDGKVTETILYVKEPLKAGNLKLIKTNLQPDGSLTTDAPEVGASVELDWKEGAEFNPEL